MERDLGTKLDWVAAEHWNTDNPHIHLLVRGKVDGPKPRHQPRLYQPWHARPR
jgi:type IV secretory pathway VirD2 relaxase